MERAILYTDGSCGINKDGGYASVLKYNDITVEIAGWETNTTSNRMEMVAAIRGLEYLKNPFLIFLASDSAYMLNPLKSKCYEDWFERKLARKNIDLWHILTDLTKYHRVEYIKIKGHSDDKMNEAVDRMAVQARKERLSYVNAYRSYSQPYAV